MQTASTNITMPPDPPLPPPPNLALSTPSHSSLFKMIRLCTARPLKGPQRRVLTGAEQEVGGEGQVC